MKPLAARFRPAYRIDFHPRAFNKPISCQAGIHSNPIETIMNGIPVIYCTKCGGFMGKGFVDGTWSKRDIQRLGNPPRQGPRTKEQIMREIWEKKEEERKARMNRSIRNFVRERMSSDL